jgi:hypothetical protein
MAAVVGDGSRITLKKLTTGRDLGNSVEVLDGIAPEDAVVINPPDALENGEQVSVTAGQDTGQNAAAPGGKPSAAPAPTPKK